MNKHYRTCQSGAVYHRTEAMALGREVSSFDMSVRFILEVDPIDPESQLVRYVADKCCQFDRLRLIS